MTRPKTARILLLAGSALAASASAALADPADSALSTSNAQPAVYPMLADDNLESIYDMPPGPESKAGNNGNVHFDFDVLYLNRYVYRGVDHDSVVKSNNTLNLVLDGSLSFDTGKYPHPIFGVLTDIYDADPVSRFQEIRPFAGAVWTPRPFLIDVRDITYIYPQREESNTSELQTKLGFDDSILYGTRQPILSPYVLGAYDYQRNNGWYLEAGLSHEFSINDIGLTVTAQADVAYIIGFQQQFVFINNLKTTGWQHVEIGFTADYSLNGLFDIPKRFGNFDLQGDLYYDTKLTRTVTATNTIWGGVGIRFSY